jgi:hypothetical protein
MNDDVVENIRTTPRGGEGLGIGEQYPVSAYGRPGDNAATDWGSATWQELAEAGFDRPDEQEPFVVGEDGTLHKLHFFVLRVGGALVAVWDEGRWWTPQESEAFAIALGNPLMRQLAEVTNMNRAERRRHGFKGGRQ